MLILVAVTVKIGRDQGLFDKARGAQTATAYESEKENLTTYIYGEDYNAATGKLDLKELKKKLEKDTDRWEMLSLDDENNPTKLTVKGKQSGKQHTINADGTIGEKKEQVSSGIVGKYMTLFPGNEGVEYIEFKGNNELEVQAKTYDSTTNITTNQNLKGEYKYDDNTHIITITGEICKNFNENGDDVEARIKEINYEKNNQEETNKVLIFGNMLACSTAGFAGFDKYTFTSGTYKNSGDSTLELSIQTDENGNNYGYLVAYGSDKTPYLCIDGYIYVGWEPYKIVSETEIGQLDDEGNVDFIFSKVD